MVAFVEDDGRASRGGGVLVLVGFVMMVVGWIGGLAGRMVRAAIVSSASSWPMPQQCSTRETPTASLPRCIRWRHTDLT